MKRKYYLRGLGLGILITALVFSITGASDISDEEVIRRAEQLGYVKSNEPSDSLGIKELLDAVIPNGEDDIHTVILPELSATPSPKPMPSFTPVPLPEPTEPVDLPENTPTIEPTETPTPEPTEVPEPTKAVETATPTPEASLVTATIVVEYGNTASVVCDKIEAAGIVANGDDLKAYLVEHNLADFINVGSYVLSEGMSLEEIANVLTK